MTLERRTDHILRSLVITGNLLAMWAGRTPYTKEESAELDNAQNAWDTAITKLRTERKEIEHIVL